MIRTAAEQLAGALEEHQDRRTGRLGAIDRWKLGRAAQLEAVRRPLPS
jgi:hypothetical protein